MDIKQKTAETYDKIAPDYSAGHFAHFRVEEFDFYKSIINGKKVIDLGCGAGRDAAVFVENGFDYTGIDASEGMLRVASERVPKGKFQKMDFSKTTFQDGEFDGFWAAASFLHIPKKDVVGVLQETKRIIKNGGVGFISVKEKNGMDEGMINENKYGGISRYFSFYTQDEFKNLLEQNGFSVLKMSTHVEDDERKTNWLCYFVKIN
ncbi:MAG: class I SAM-dependent methyltransferase [Parcubacteria group bacterium]|nr:class I SAM-dependent methyltransferase [Parcubacteria group bacterium]